MNQTASSQPERFRKVARLMLSRLNSGSYRECLFCEDPSQRKKVRGHSIQRAVISEYLADNGHVIMFSNEQIMKLINERNADPSAIAKRVGVNQATTGFFTCSEHEQIFTPIEQGTLNLKRSSHRFLFALRAIAYQTWRIKSVHDAWYYAINETGSVPASAIVQLELFSERLQEAEGILKSMTRWYNDKEFERIKHKVLRLKTSPTLAVCEWSAFGNESYLKYGLTVLPINASHTTAMIHYFEEDTNMLYDSLGHLLATTKQKQKKILSRVIIEDCENVTLSPHIWNQFSSVKQQRIKEHFRDTIANPELHRLPYIEGEEHLNFFVD